MPWFIDDVYESSDIAILNIKGSDFCCTINGTSKKRSHEFNATYEFDRKNWNIIKHKNVCFFFINFIWNTCPEKL